MLPEGIDKGNEIIMIEKFSSETYLFLSRQYWKENLSNND